MFEKVNMYHPDKVADRIAGALVDEAYRRQDNPKIAIEVLIGHGKCSIVSEASVHLDTVFVIDTVRRIMDVSRYEVDYREFQQDLHLANNQCNKIRCGDNGIFKGMPVTREQRRLTEIARRLSNKFQSDGKYILEVDKLIVCQSNAEEEEIRKLIPEFDARPSLQVNPLGAWTGGTDVDCGATNRKLGSDMGDSVTGGGLHGKDLSKADVSVNIYAWLLAQETGVPVNLCCAIGDEYVGSIQYGRIVDIARDYIKACGGFEKFAEWGLIR